MKKCRKSADDFVLKRNGGQQRFGTNGNDSVQMATITKNDESCKNVMVARVTTITQNDDCVKKKRIVSSKSKSTTLIND